MGLKTFSENLRRAGAVMTGTLLVAGIAAAANAQTLGIGTSGQGTATYSIGSAIAKVVGDKAGLQIVVQPQGGTGKVVPLVNSGRLDFGLANILEVTNAVKGKGPFKDRDNPNLKIAAVIYPFKVGFFVRNDSPAKSVLDIKGMKISSGYDSQKIIGILVKAALANGGLTFEDMDTVPTANIIGNANDFAAGKTDVGFFALGSGKVSQVNASVGGLRFITFESAGEAEKRMQAVISQAYIQRVEPRADLVGVAEPINVMAYDYILYVGAHIADDVVAKVVKAMAENGGALAASFANFNDLVPSNMAKDVSLDYHPGAISYYQGAGMWQR